MSFNIINTEQVSKYHPDKFADQISDYFVDYILSMNHNAHCAIETFIKDTTVVVGGEISGYSLTEDEIYDGITKVATDLGYSVTNIINLLGKQSYQINRAVNDTDIAAGDQGFVYGYATRETPEFLPLGLFLANKIIKAVERYVITSKGIIKGDAKTQVVVKDGLVSKIVLSVCYDRIYTLADIRIWMQDLLYETLKRYGINYNVKLIINPSGIWTIGGATADSGLTGRKIVADQYGGYMPVGGGAFSGKDLTKVDRSGAYMARKVAVEILKENEDLEWVKIQVGYAIGIVEPISLNIITDKGIYRYSRDIFNRFKVSNMVHELSYLNVYHLSKGNHFRDGILL